MTLQTIAVRYEDEQGRHIDVHEAAERVYINSGMVRVTAHKCSCCDCEKELLEYSIDSIVKMDLKPSDHDL